MNDLLSPSDILPHDVAGDLELGNASSAAPSDTHTSLARFFQDVGIIKSEIERVKHLLVKLQEAHEESKSVLLARAMKSVRDRMDKDVAEVLQRARFIKAKVEDLDRANEENRQVPGCEKGSSTDRTRISVTDGMGQTLKELMGEIQTLRQRMMSEYKETVERRYYTITGQNADEETIDRLIESGESEKLVQKAIQKQGRVQIMDAIEEMKERHDAVKEMEKSLSELHTIFLDMAVLVEAQGVQVDNIEAAVGRASSFVKRGTDQLQTTKKLQWKSRKCTCIAIIVLLIVVLLVLVVAITAK